MSALSVLFVLLTIGGLIAMTQGVGNAGLATAVFLLGVAVCDGFGLVLRRLDALGEAAEGSRPRRPSRHETE